MERKHKTGEKLKVDPNSDELSHQLEVAQKGLHDSKEDLKKIPTLEKEAENFVQNIGYTTNAMLVQSGITMTDMNDYMVEVLRARSSDPEERSRIKTLKKGFTNWIYQVRVYSTWFRNKT